MGFMSVLRRGLVMGLALALGLMPTTVTAATYRYTVPTARKWVFAGPEARTNVITVKPGGMHWNLGGVYYDASTRRGIIVDSEDWKSTTFTMKVGPNKESDINFSSGLGGSLHSNGIGSDAAIGIGLSFLQLCAKDYARYKAMCKCGAKSDQYFWTEEWTGIDPEYALKRYNYGNSKQHALIQNNSYIVCERCGGYVDDIYIFAYEGDEANDSWGYGAEAHDMKDGECTLCGYGTQTTAIKAKKITLTAPSNTLAAGGDPMKLGYALEPAGANSSVTFSTNKPKVATVTNDGVVTPVGAGTVKITAKTSNGKTAAVSLKITGSKEFDRALMESSRRENKFLSLKSAEYSYHAYNRSKLVKELRDELGFKLAVIKGYPNTVERDGVGYTISCRTITHNKKQYNFYAVVIRGTTGDREWLSNFRVGRGMDDHQGFSNAMVNIASDLRGVINTPKETNKIWITGHSRGAAVSNLLAEFLSDSNAFYGDSVFAYTFACPRVTYDANPNVSIYNYTFAEDMVPDIPLSEWGMWRHGRGISELVKNVPNIAIAYRKERGKKFKPISSENKKIVLYALSSVTRNEFAAAVDKLSPKKGGFFPTLEAIIRILALAEAPLHLKWLDVIVNISGKDATAAHEMICYLTWMRNYR